MKNWTLLILISVLTASLFTSCGPSEEEQRQAEQARQDSLEQVRQQRLAEQRRDSIAQARKDSIAADTTQSSNQEEQMDVTFDSDGAFSVQVESWRSENKAQSQVDKWVNRGFANAFVVEYGNEDTGNIWYRVRLGRLSSREAAEELRQQLKSKYEAPAWIASAQ